MSISIGSLAKKNYLFRTKAHYLIFLLIIILVFSLNIEIKKIIGYGSRGQFF